MQFSNKLNFLMNITNTSNKELAEAISVDRSLISLLRSGKRKTPRNHDHIRHMASFFARRCSADFQFHALAEMLENVAPIPPAPDLPPEGPLTHPSMPSEGQTQFFYGNEGKREATRQIINIAKQLNHPSSIYFISDVNLEWLFEDYQFMNEFSVALSAIFQKGVTLYHIMPSLNFMNRYVESLRYWLPIYASGQAKVYYYPRLRDNLYRRSLIIIPGYCVQSSTCIGNASNLISLFSTDQELVNAYNDQFQYELSLCRPALVSHTDPNEFITCFRELLNDNSPVIHKASKPSPYTLPTECLDAFINETPESTWRTTLQMDLADASLFEEKLSRSSCIELCPLATPADVRAGKILFGTDYKVADKHPVYTPEIYAMHLQHILELMDKYENYHFVPVTPTDRQDYNLFASESGPTLLVSNPSPFYMLEIRRPELSHACYEYLMRQADLVGYEGIRRAKIRMQIRELIQELRQ